MGQVLMTNVEVEMGKAQTVTLPRNYYALLLFFNSLEPSRDTEEKSSDLSFSAQEAEQPRIDNSMVSAMRERGCLCRQ